MTVSQKDLERFNKYCNKMIKVGYGNLENLESKQLDVPLGYYFLVASLRNMNKKQLKNLFYDIGLRQVMKISCVSTTVSVDSLKKDDFGKKDSPWRVILA